MYFVKFFVTYAVLSCARRYRKTKTNCSAYNYFIILYMMTMTYKHLMTGLAVAAVLTTSGLSVSANDINESNEDHRPGIFQNYEEKKEARQEKRHERKEERKEEKHAQKQENKDFFSTLTSDLSQETQEQLQTIKENHKAEFSALKEQYGDDKEAMREAMKTLREQHYQEVVSVLPEDKAEALAAHREATQAKREAMKQEMEAKRQEYFAKKEERFAKISEKFDTLETNNPEKAQIVYQKVSEKIQEKLTVLYEKAADKDENDNIHDVISMMEDLLQEIAVRMS